MVGRPLAWWWCAAAALLAVAAAAHVHLAPAAPFLDEGDHANTARLLAHGAVMYRDAFNEKGPGLYWIGAALFTVFGDDFLALRRAAMAGMLASLALLLALGRRAGKPWAGLAATTLFAGFHLFFLGAIWQSESVLTPLLLGILLLLAPPPTGDPPPLWRFVAAGLALFLATSIKQTAWLLVVGALVGAGLAGCRTPQFAALLAGLAAPWAGALLYFARHDALAVFWNGYLFPATSLSWSRYAAGPNRAPVAFEVAAAWMAGFALWPALQRRNRKPPLERAYLPPMLAAAMLMMFPRLSAHHVLPALAAASLGFALWVAGSAGRTSVQRLGPPAAFAALCAAALWTAPAAYRANVGVFTAPQWREVAAAVAAETSPGDPLFVFPHDSTYYYLAGREPPGRIGFLLPWTTPPATLNEFLREYAARPPRAVLYVYHANGTPYGVRPREYLAPLLDRLARDFTVRRVFDNGAVWLAPRSAAEADPREACRIRRLLSDDLPSPASGATLRRELEARCP